MTDPLNTEASIVSYIYINEEYTHALQIDG